MNSFIITKRRNNRQRGFNLVEVLVALFVLSMGLLGLAMLQVQSLKFNTNAYFRAQATNLAYDIIERMRANPAAVAAGSYLLPNDSAVSTALSTYSACSGSTCACGSGTQCTSANMATYDLGEWLNSISTVLPQGNTNGNSWIELVSTANSTLGAARTLRITIRWSERGVNSQQASGLNVEQQWLVELFG